MSNLATAQGDQNTRYPAEILYHIPTYWSALFRLHAFPYPYLCLWNLSLKYIIAKCTMLQKCKWFCGIILYRLLTMKRYEIKILRRIFAAMWSHYRAGGNPLYIYVYIYYIYSTHASAWKVPTLDLDLWRIVQRLNSHFATLHTANTHTHTTHTSM